MNAYLLIGLIGLLVLLSGCTSEPVTKYVCSDGKTIVTDITTCPSSGTAIPELSQDEALTVCSGMPSTSQGSYEDICIIGIAGKYQDTALCKKVSRDQRTQCYTLVAEVKKNPDTCLEAETQIEQCYRQYATDKKDGSICGKITDVSYKDSCYNDLANQLSDASLCDNIRTISQKDNCYSSIAMRLGDSSYCDKITNTTQKENCLQNAQNSGGQKIAMPR